mgnify:FL=1
MKKLIILSFLLVTCNLFAQPAATPASEVIKGIQQKQQLAETSIVKNLPFKSIGPTIMSGRVVDFAVNPTIL